MYGQRILIDLMRNLIKITDWGNKRNILSELIKYTKKYLGF